MFNTSTKKASMPKMCSFVFFHAFPSCVYGSISFIPPSERWHLEFVFVFGGLGVGMGVAS